VLNPSPNDSAFISAHTELSRRCFIQAGVAGMSIGTMLRTADASAGFAPTPDRNPTSQSSDKAGAEQDPYFTPSVDFRDVSRGKPIPHTLPEEQRITAGLTRETWKLEVVSDPDNPARIKRPMTIQDGTALDFPTLLKVGERHAVRIPKIMTCLNLGCPLGMGLWEGVPLREVIWMTKPIENLRRVFYYGFHNNSPDQMFRSSLPIGRILEDPPGMPPVILCYKLNGDWLDAKRGGPVRIVVPEAYGFKSVKWLSHVVLTNLAHANDTYAEQNNDIDSPLKTFAATLSVPEVADAGQSILVSGYAQVGVSGLSAVQVMIEPADTVHAEDDPYFTNAEWKAADLLSAPQKWTALAGDTIPSGSFGFNDAGQPSSWPMRLTKAHWAIVLPGLPAGEYKLRCRTIDESGHAQPMPRPFRKSGHASIETVSIIVR
jgi:DMSO/TMAO reductase YedYZ molybdopterin-dependent catalytic subunit